MISYAELRRNGGDKAEQDYKQKSIAERNKKWNSAKKVRDTAHLKGITQNDLAEKLNIPGRKK